MGASGLIQDGASFPPIERIDLPFNDTGVPQTVGIVILDFLKVNGLGSAEPREFDLFVLGIPGLDEFRVPQSSVPNNSDADLVCSVGSVGLGAGDPLGQFSNEIRSYSSRGPTNDGRLKPDIVAPDGVSITGNGGFPVPFFGTSAAAPHAAGVAALVLEADNSLSPAALTSSLIATRALSPSQLAGVLNSTAVDLGAPGPDNTFGFGRIDAFAAVQAVVAAGPSPSPSPTATPGPTASPGPPTTAPPTNPPGDGMTTSNGGCSVAGSVTATTAVVNILMSILVLIGFGLVMRLRSVIR